jgi:hypothetical protein
MDAEPELSRSEARILGALVAGELSQIALDWLVVQHLKQRGLVEETPAGPKITDKGRRVIRDHQALPS